MLCERCGRDGFKHVVCDYCNRKIDQNCMKSSKRKSKTTRLIICKDCWSIMSRRTTYKQASAPVVQVREERRW